MARGGGGGGDPKLVLEVSSNSLYTSIQVCQAFKFGHLYRLSHLRIIWWGGAPCARLSNKHWITTRPHAAPPPRVRHTRPPLLLNRAWGCVCGLAGAQQNKASTFHTHHLRHAHTHARTTAAYPSAEPTKSEAAKRRAGRGRRRVCVWVGAHWEGRRAVEEGPGLPQEERTGMGWSAPLASYTSTAPLAPPQHNQAWALRLERKKVPVVGWGGRGRERTKRTHNTSKTI